MVVVTDLVAPVVFPGRLRDQSQPVLLVDELTLRPWRSDALLDVVRAYQDPAIQRWHVRTMSDREAEEWVASWPERWAAETGAGWAVCDEEGRLARMSLRALDLAEGMGEVAYWVLPEALMTHVGRCSRVPRPRRGGRCPVSVGRQRPPGDVDERARQRPPAMSMNAPVT